MQKTIHAQQPTQPNRNPCTSNGNGKKPPSDTLAVSAAAPDPTPIPLTDEQRAEIRSEQEQIMQQHKGDEYAYYHALYIIKEAAAYRPQFTRIQDYALIVHKIKRRDWHKKMNHVKANEAIRAYLKRKCPNGHIPSGEIISKAKSKLLEPLLKHPQHVEAVFDESDQQPKDTNGEIPTSAMSQIATKYKKLMVGEREEKMSAVEIDDRFKNWFVCGDMLTSDAVRKDHFDMVICSPPYNLNVVYDGCNDDMTTTQYLTYLENWCARIRYSLKRCGRAAINLPNTYSRTKGQMYVDPLPARLCSIMEKFGDMHLYQWLTWDRIFLTDAQDRNWGSYHSCSQPNARRQTENILVFAKGSTKRTASETLRDITEAAFKAWAYDIWRINPECSITWHPCPFPLEMPIRLMMLYGQRKDKILDPFGGAGTTALAAAMLDRECTSIDLSAKYTDFGRKRLVEYLDSGKAKKRLDAILHKAEYLTKPKDGESAA